MEDKIKYGMFELTIGKDLKGELIGLLIERDNPDSVISVISEDKEVNKFLEGLTNIKQGLEEKQSICCFFDKTTESYQVNFEEWKRRKEDNSICGFNILEKTQDPNLQKAFDQMEQKMEAIRRSKEQGKQCVSSMTAKLAEGYCFVAEVCDQTVNGCLILKQQEKYKEMIQLDEKMLFFLEFLPWGEQIISSEYRVEVARDQASNLYQATFKVRNEDNMRRYDWKEIYHEKDKNPNIALLRVAERTKDRKERNTICQKIKHY